MTYLLLDAVSCIVGLSLIGYPLTRLSRAIEGAERLPWALILGICVMIVFVRTINSFTGISTAAPVVAVVILAWLVYNWRKKSLRTLLIGDLAALDPFLSLCWLTAVMVLVIALNFPVLSHHAFTFEYSPNQDAIYYITNARWMLGHSFGETVTFTANDPIFYVSQVFFGAAPPLGRVGASGLLAIVSAFTGQNPLVHFQALQTVAVVSGVAVSALLLPRPVYKFTMRPKLTRLATIAAIVFTPVFLQIPINSSFANAYGVVLMTGFVLISLRTPTRGLDILGLLLFAGVLATYPELSPIGLAIIGSVLLTESALRSQSLSETFARGARVLLTALTVVIALPWISTFALMVLKTVYLTASTQGASWPDPYAGLSALQLPLAVFTTSRSLAAIIPGLLVILVAAIICVTSLTSIQRTRDSAFPLGVLLALVIFLGYIFHVDFNYGKLKILEYFSLFLTPSLIILCGFSSIPTHTRKLLQAFSYIALLCILFINVGASYLLLKQGLRIAHDKYIAEDFLDTVKAADNWPGRHYLAARFTTDPFFYSMWIAYFSHQPVVFSKEFGSGGYLQAFVTERPAAPYDMASAAITDEAAFSSTMFGAKILNHFGRFLLVDQRSSSQLSSNGLYANEGGWSWMAKKLILSIRGGNAKFVNLNLSDRFAPEGGTENILITIDNKHCVFLASTTSNNKLSIAIPESKNRQVTISPMGSAISPSALGQSTDTRILTYRVSDLRLSSNAIAQAVTCGGSQ